MPNNFINQFPYSDFHEMNLDWILKTIKALSAELNSYEALNSVTYEGLWNISKQYEKWSIVNDASTGWMYISKIPVPSGILITNETYWMLASPFKVDVEFDDSSYNAIANKPVTDKFAEVDATDADLDERLRTEINNRSSADTDLDNRITEEVTDLENADTALGDRITTETTNRENADTDLSTRITNEVTARTNSDASLSSRIDAIAHLPSGSTSGDAELIDIRTNLEGMVYSSAGDAVRGLEKKVNDIQNYKFVEGYVHVNGTIVDQHATRRRTDFLLCDENIEVTYAGATNTANVCGIAFFTKEKIFISGISENGEEGTEITVTSPAGTRYVIISTTTNLLNTFVYSLPYGALSTIAKDFYKFAYDVEDFIPFETSGVSTRSIRYTNIEGIKLAFVADDEYDVALYYNNSTENTGWHKSIDLTQYDNPNSLQLRKSDNSVLPKDSCLYKCKGFTDTSFVPFTMFNKTVNQTCFVNCDDGNDTNDGVARHSAFRTIQKALNSGFKNILLKPGTYTEAITIESDDITIMVDNFYGNFEYPGSIGFEKAIIDATDNTYGIYCNDHKNIKLFNIEVENSTGNGYYFYKCEQLSFHGCIASNVGGHGFYFRDCDGSFYNCIAHHIGVIGGSQHHDGFNIHGIGTTYFINCSAYLCEDDGISHHDSCLGFIDGGEYYSCGKGGVASPTHGAIIDVRNIYSHNNKYGIYCSADEDYGRTTKVNFTNCACVNNITTDILITEYYNANVWNCIYNSISSGSNVNIIG